MRVEKAEPSDPVFMNKLLTIVSNIHPLIEHAWRSAGLKSHITPNKVHHT